MAERIHIMVGEDEQHTLLAISLVLQKAGFQVTALASGAGVINEVEGPGKSAAPVDLLLLDLQMPGLTGIELIAALAERSVGWPVLVMSGHSDGVLIAEAMRQGCVGYLEKPFEPDELLARIKWALNKPKDLATRRATMSASSEYSGLCSTCNHAPGCGYRTGSDAVVQCEEFDAHTPMGPRGERGERPGPALLRTTAGGEPKGLCVNCDLRGDCLTAAGSKTVWHCENYQ